MSIAAPFSLNDACRTLRRFMRCESGVTSIEYGVIAALTALAAIPAVSALGGRIGSTLDAVSDALDGAPEAAPGRSR